jgi:hypothetical protein
MAVKGQSVKNSSTILTEIMVLTLHSENGCCGDGDSNERKLWRKSLFAQYIHHCSLRIQAYPGRTTELSRECFSDLFLSICSYLNVTYLIHTYTQCFSLALSGVGNLPPIACMNVQCMYGYVFGNQKCDEVNYQKTNVYL